MVGLAFRDDTAVSADFLAGHGGELTDGEVVEVNVHTALIETRAGKLAGDALVVCGSLHRTARAQIDALRSSSIAGVTVLASPTANRPFVAPTDAERVACDLGTAAHDLLATRRFGVLVILGGDTAAAILGDEQMVVGGTLAPGVPWSQRGDGSGPLVITKAGGYGHPTMLLDLLAGVSPSEER